MTLTWFNLKWYTSQLARRVWDLDSKIHEHHMETIHLNGRIHILEIQCQMLLSILEEILKDTEDKKASDAPQAH